MASAYTHRLPSRETRKTSSPGVCAGGCVLRVFVLGASCSGTLRGAPAAVEKKQKPLPRLNVHSGFWILASIVVTYYVDFFKTIRENFHTSSWFLFGGALLLVSVSVAFYCILYLEWYRGIEDYDVKYPALIPITTAAFIVAGICFNIALWPVWSFFTPLLLFTQFMGLVMFISLLG